MFSMWEKVSGAIMDGPYPWHPGPRRKRKVGHKKSRPGRDGWEIDSLGSLS
jgi:hypothetical protein